MHFSKKRNVFDFGQIFFQMSINTYFILFFDNT